MSILELLCITTGSKYKISMAICACYHLVSNSVMNMNDLIKLNNLLMDIADDIN